MPCVYRVMCALCMHRVCVICVRVYDARALCVTRVCARCPPCVMCAPCVCVCARLVCSLPCMCRVCATSKICHGGSTNLGELFNPRLKSFMTFDNQETNFQGHTLYKHVKWIEIVLIRD